MEPRGEQAGGRSTIHGDGAGTPRRIPGTLQCALLDLLQAKTAISQQIDGIDPTAALEMAGAGDGAQVQTQDVGLAVYKYLGGE